MNIMFRVPDLPYAYNALEPYIDEQTMHLHHDKHHQAYVDKLNAALQGHEDLAAMPIEKILSSLDQIPENIRTAVRNNGGGHANHSMFWEIMQPNGGGEATGELASALDSTFGDFASFKEKFSQAATTVFGSGWAWLVLDNGSLSITTTPNQDSPLMEGKQPIMGLDVWEHAYYLKYQNRRPEYIDAWWQVLNWQAISNRFEELKNK